MRYLHTLFASFFLLLAFPAAALADSGAVDGEELTDLGSWAVISGALLPFAIGLIVQQKWEHSEKALVAVGVCVVDAIVVTYFEHGIHIDEHLMVTAGLVFATAQTTYKGLWKPVLGVGGSNGVSPFSEKGLDSKKANDTRG